MHRPVFTSQKSRVILCGRYSTDGECQQQITDQMACCSNLLRRKNIAALGPVQLSTPPKTISPKNKGK